MAPLGLMSVGANLLVKSLGLFSSASVVRCTCVAPVIKSFCTITGGPPKKPLTAYMSYVKEIQPMVSKQNPGLKNVDVMRKIAEQWRMMTAEQKQPFEDLSLTSKEQYKLALEKFKSQLTPAQTSAFAEERRQRIAKRKAIRKKRELTSLGKPKRPRSAFNIFMAEHFEEADGNSIPTKLKSLRDAWNRFNDTQKKIYKQLAEDDSVRYKNEIKSWEEHMIEIGREDLVRRKVRRVTKAKKERKKKTKVIAKKAKVSKKKVVVAGTAVKKTKSTKK